MYIYIIILFSQRIKVDLLHIDLLNNLQTYNKKVDRFSIIYLHFFTCVIVRITKVNPLRLYTRHHPPPPRENWKSPLLPSPITLTKIFKGRILVNT